jgi:hypothetical protein
MALIDRPGGEGYNFLLKYARGTPPMNLKKIILFALGVAAVVAAFLALKKRPK